MFVIGVGEKKTPDSFRNSCDTFLFLENMSEELNTVKTDKNVQTKENTADENANEEINLTVIHRLLKIASEIYQDDDGYVNVSAAGQYIKRVKPDFDVRTFGYLKLPDLIKNFPEQYEMKRYKGKGTVTIVAYRCKSEQDYSQDMPAS